MLFFNQMKRKQLWLFHCSLFSLSEQPFSVRFQLRMVLQNLTFLYQILLSHFFNRGAACFCKDLIIPIPRENA
jgi:hypothetical protein